MKPEELRALIEKLKNENALALTTIDELMLSQGAEAVSIFMKVSWLPKFPFVYAKNYYKTFRNPNNGPLSGLKENIMRELQTKETPDNPETEKKITDN